MIKDPERLALTDVENQAVPPRKRATDSAGAHSQQQAENHLPKPFFFCIARCVHAEWATYATQLIFAGFKC